MSQPLVAAILIALTVLSGAVVSAQDDGQIIELEWGDDLVLEINAADGPVQGVIIKQTMIVGGIVAYETADGWELAPKTFSTVVTPDSPIFGLEEGDAWVIAPAPEGEPSG